MRNFEFYQNWKMPYWGSVLFPLVSVLVFLLVVWTLYWKGRAMWLVARKSYKLWFVALLLVNTMGILDILYVYYFSKKRLGGDPIESKAKY